MDLSSDLKPATVGGTLCGFLAAAVAGTFGNKGLLAATLALTVVDRQAIQVLLIMTTGGEHPGVYLRFIW